jgi:hypothetical protein
MDDHTTAANEVHIAFEREVPRPDVAFSIARHRVPEMDDLTDNSPDAVDIWSNVGLMETSKPSRRGIRTMRYQTDLLIQKEW